MGEETEKREWTKNKKEGKKAEKRIDKNTVFIPFLYPYILAI